MRAVLTLFSLILIQQILLPQGKTNWLVQESNTNKNLKGIFFIDTLKGWAIGDNVILRTTNGGGNWITENSSFYWNDVFFLDTLVGIITGKDGRLYKTTNGGLNYTPRASGVTDILTNLYFRDSVNGFVGGEILNKVIMSTDAGDDWFLAPNIPGLPIVFKDYYFQNELLGWTCGIELLGGSPPSIRGIILKTTDKGYSWNVNYQHPSGSYLEEIIFFNDSIGCIRGSPMFRTIDTGTNWQAYSIEFLTNSICKVDSLVGWMVGRFGVIFKTENASLNWELQELDSTRSYNDVFFVDNEHGWIAGNNGLILCTKQYDPINSLSEHILLNSFSLSQNYPNPFNPTTTIKYQIPEISFVTLKVYDVLGNEVVTLVYEEKPIGNYEVEFDEANLTSGIYFYRLRAGAYIETKKMVLLK